MDNITAYTRGELDKTEMCCMKMVLDILSNLSLSGQQHKVIQYNFGMNPMLNPTFHETFFKQAKRPELLMAPPVSERKLEKFKEYALGMHARYAKELDRFSTCGTYLDLTWFHQSIFGVEDLLASPSGPEFGRLGHYKPGTTVHAIK
jgi:hypothetical protein